MDNGAFVPVVVGVVVVVVGVVVVVVVERIGLLLHCE